jgi:preprotein translocase subunit SecA
MIGNIVAKVFGSKHERDIKKLWPIVEVINRLCEEFNDLSDDQLRAKTDEFRSRIAEATREVTDAISAVNEQLRADTSPTNGQPSPAEDQETPSQEEAESLHDQLHKLEKQEHELIEQAHKELLPEAFAAVKQTCKRLVGKSWRVCDQEIRWDMIPYDVQLIGGVVLHEGKIAEMATGEGKTLVATMPLYLNALSGKGVHLVTVNDYLARRDAEWMGEIFKFLGLTVAYIQHDMSPTQRRAAYHADITYGTNNEFGFDYLRDNMSIRLEDTVQGEHNYSIVDEVDSVLIDEARTPLIISGPVEHSTHRYDEMKPLVERLVREQMRLINSILADGERLLREQQEYEAGIQLLRASRGAPKNKKLAKLLQEVGVKKLIRGVENDYMRDKKMHEIDEELYFAIDEKAHTIDMTEKGRDYLSPNDPEMFTLPDLSEKLHNIETDESLPDEAKLEKRTRIQEEYQQKSERLHNISQLLRAYSLFEKDVEYVVQDGKVLIVDEFTGRLMPGRRFSDGLHQALEAKESVKIERETQTLATITLQNYFRMYNKLAGMTGTAETEATEFWAIYKLDVTVIPTNKPIRRDDQDDQIYRTKREKYKAIIDEIAEMYERKRPVLVGTVSVEVSETLSRMLKRKGVPHSVLNAKQHQKEADIVAHAGQPGAVTIATNMAGRGTDIKLGTGVAEKNGGLAIVGTERHESRRIDRQLRGRSGRQGDPGSSIFYLSLEDDLMRLFQTDRVAGIMDRLGLEEGEVITHPMVTRSIERAQKRVEGHNFDIRKHLLEYDDVMNQQRKNVYNRRAHALRGENLRNECMDLIADYLDRKIDQYTQDGYSEEWDWAGLRNDFRRIFLVTIPLREEEQTGLTQDQLFDILAETAKKAYMERERNFGDKLMREIERFAMLRVIDERWREHLYAMDQLKEGIGLRAYGQKNPLLEYKSEGFKMFTEMLDMIGEQVVDFIFKARVQPEPMMLQRQRPAQMMEVHDSAEGLGFARLPTNAPAQQQGGRPQKVRPVVVGEKVGRNDPCPCGSGKKYKKCHGAVA